ncbi:hypothetical protein COU58_03380 [Candidatus Pacearchaeota archaeon CG10_big_fil_rev_8_21_14_0_10_32_42]|nr:MAG: hypothetical protein COU58_03380 [Candidatus Pacearchaeota archaeon CG10_big_fil_rev_8_21_14_0_10_32_42]
MIIKRVSGKVIKDSRKDLTIEVTIETNVGKFSASAPNGKSKGKYEAKPYMKSIQKDLESLENLSDYFSDEHIEKFSDLRRIEDIVKGHIGANTLFAFESAVLKAVSKEQKKEIWQLINPDSKKIPRLVGNAIGGGLHSESSKKPDFQEFLIISPENSAISSLKKSTDAKSKSEELLQKKDPKFKSKKNDEDAWMTSLNEKEVLDLMSELKIPLGLDIASSSFYKRKKYHYKNPLLDRTPDEELMYLKNLIKNYPLIYIEDPFQEEDFENFSKLLKLNQNVMIVGDDLTVTNYKRVEKAIEMKSINALIVKPNQNGSLIEVERVVKLSKENGIKIIFSHRSGETKEDILSDLAFGFQADFIKCGITGPERLAKIKRLIEIEKSLK